MEEVWRDIDGYEGLYKVSNYGNVKSLNYRNHGYAKNLTPKTNNYGRLWVELFKQGNKKQFLIHRLVGQAFIPNPDGFPQINHIDENPKNNVVDNLEWCTGSYNKKYSYERHPERWKEQEEENKLRRNGKRKSLKVDQFTMDGELVKRWPNSRTVFLETGMSQWSISQCCDGKRSKAYGFKWHYAI